MPVLSVVVVNYNTREATSACLRSVLQASPSVDLELIVVDNGSTDGSAAAFREGFPEATVDRGRREPRLRARREPRRPAPRAASGCCC